MLRNRPIRSRLISGINTTVFRIPRILVVVALLLVQATYAPSFHSNYSSVEFPKVMQALLLRRALSEGAITITVMRDSKVLCDNYFLYVEDLPAKDFAGFTPRFRTQGVFEGGRTPHTGL